MAIRLLDITSLQTTSLSTVYLVPISTTASISSAVLTNESTTQQDVDVYITTGTTDTLLTTAKLLGGIGKSMIIKELIGGINSQNQIKLQPSSSNKINFFLYGTVTNS